MPNTVIENPILNSPYREPTRHWKFSDDGITDEVVETRRTSSYFLPIASPRARGGAAAQLTFQTEWTQDRLEEDRFINEVRKHVAAWRSAHWPNTTRLTQAAIGRWQGFCFNHSRQPENGWSPEHDQERTDQVRQTRPLSWPGNPGLRRVHGQRWH